MRIGLRALLQLLALPSASITSPSEPVAQPARSPIRVRDEIACAACEVRLDATVTLRVTGDTLDPFPSAVRRDRRGRYWLFRRSGGPVVFDSSGRRIAIVGRRGQGPGEYLAAHDVLQIAPDSFVVFDGATLRATVLDGSFRVARTIALPFSLRNPVVESWPEAVFATGNFATPADAGWPLHRLTFADGHLAVVTQSFGQGDGELRAEESPRTRHFFTSPRGRYLWAAWMYGYQFSQFQTNGRLLQTFVRRPEWFAAPSPVSLGTPSSPPPPLVGGVEEDSAGRLWFGVRVASNEWKSAWPKVAPGTREVPSSAIDFEKLYDTMIEIVNPITRTVVTRKRVNEYLVGTLPGPQGVFYRSDELGEGVVTIRSLVLVGR